MEQLVRIAADWLLFAIIAVAGCAGAYYVVKTHNIRRFAPVAIMAALTSLYVAKLISLVYQPAAARPYIQQGVEAGASYINNPGFPSDHALLATVIVIMLAMLTPYKKLAIGLFVFVLVMSLARVLAFVHTPLDVAGGIAIAAVGSFWYKKLKI